MTDNVAGGQSAILEDDTTYFNTVKDFILNVISDRQDLPRPKSENLHESQGKIQG